MSTSTSTTAGTGGDAGATSPLAAASTTRIDVDVGTLADPSAPALEELIPVFHQLIRERALDDLVIDVADYAHVPEGPGVVLVGHDAIYSYRDRGGVSSGRRGLRYSRRRDSWRPVADAASSSAWLCAALRHAFAACRTLEDRLAGRLRFDPGSFEVRLNDRLAAPNEASTRASWRAEVAAAAGVVYPEPTPRVLDLVGDPRERVAFRVEASGEPGDLDALIGRLG
ncbi:MAG TPA: hypothetical protein VMV46_03135 [Thermoanaerobaculia bacterium]|nr:hypothetical protein [Thermoanaerobaculia bacterium]